MRGKFVDLFGAVYDHPAVFRVSEKPDHLGMVRVTNYYRVISVPCMPLYRRVHFGHTLARRIQKSRPLLVKLLAAVGWNSVGADHNFFPRAVLDPVFVHHPLFFQHRQDLPVMDERSEGADILTFLAALDSVHGDFDCVPDPFAKAGCPGDDNFHFLPIFRLGSLYAVKASHSRRCFHRNCTAENPTNFDGRWQPWRAASAWVYALFVIR